MASHDGVALHRHRCTRRWKRSLVCAGAALAARAAVSATVRAVVGTRILEVGSSSAASARLAIDMTVVSAPSRGVVGSPWERHCGARNAGGCRGTDRPRGAV
jgi:hypothetical protein